MKTIKIFLGSSLDELYDERRMLGDYIMNSVRSICKFDDVDVDLLKCEDMDLGYTGEPSQNIINNQLKDCNYFIFVFKKKAGGQTRLEYDIAREIQKAGDHKTIIRVYIFNGPEEGKEPELLGFQEQLKKDGLYWSTYNNPEDIRGKIEHHLIQFERQLLGKTKPSIFCRKPFSYRRSRIKSAMRPSGIQKKGGHESPLLLHTINSQLTLNSKLSTLN